MSMPMRSSVSYWYFLFVVFVALHLVTCEVQGQRTASLSKMRPFQKNITRSIAEATLYAEQHLGASEANGVESMMSEAIVGHQAEATEHILHRQGIDKMKQHIDVAHLWLQDEVKSNRLKDEGAQQLNHHATSMEYVDAQENLKSGDDMVFWVDESN